MNRRDALQRLARTGALALASGPALPGLAAGAAGRTPAQPEGPYYPVEPPPDADWDLLRVRGQGGRAGGAPLTLRGRVLATEGRPISGAIVEIWQADHRGNYNHPRARGRAAFDPAFQGYGTARTDGDGRYRFLTIVPVPYRGRPPHIHAKAGAEGREPLTTQLYIKDHPENGRDGMFWSIRHPGKRRLMMDIRPARLGDDLRGKSALFDFVL